MNLGQRFRSEVPWAVSVAVGVAVGLGMGAWLGDIHTNRTCGLLPPSLGAIVLALGALGLAALVSLIAAIRAESARSTGSLALLGTVVAGVVFLVAAANLPPAGCHLT